MLKRLELIGFKSFADKTQFDFPPGVTAIVGPNGSGKSNVVDAVRWVLGEQSAKSLRGGEMADVIFNGSASRRSLGLAEVTMTFDNTRRILGTDADEVQITRRVYRDGEGEYLINQQPSRLRDIKELFLGSGAGTDAYSIIEQGRVDVLLQASTKDRRTIFEEAAGISRFKAKKTETLRKLERVDQNLQRLRDIIDEVEKQLRSVKLQASKAQRYQEYSERLKELRVALGLHEYQQLAGQLDAETAVLDALRTTLAEQTAQAEAWETRIKALEEALARLDETVHEQETHLAAARQQIAAEDATLKHERSASESLESTLASTGKQLGELTARVAALADDAARAAADVAAIETQRSDKRQAVDALEAELRAFVTRLAELEKQVQANKVEHFDKMREAARLQNDAVSFKAQVDNLSRERDRLRLQTEKAAGDLASLDVELQELAQADEALQARLTEARGRQADQRSERERLRQQAEEIARVVSGLHAQRSGVASRIEVLEGLERSHEGLGTGVREVYALLEQPDPGPWRVVRGLVADLLTVAREYAPLLDLALGEWAQRFVVHDPALLEQALAARGQPFSGRVSFLPFTASPEAPPPSDDVASLPGVVALAERLVSCDTDLAGLPARLLGRTLVVRDLESARRIAATSAGYRFVTLQGELLEADGTLTVGTHHAEAGILSRKSELRELRQQLVALDRRSAATERELVEVRDRGAALDAEVARVQEEIDVLAEQSADLKSRLGQRQAHRHDLDQTLRENQDYLSGIDRDIQHLEASWHQARAQAEEADRRVQALEAQLREAERAIRDGGHERQQRQHDCTTAKVALAQVEERLAAVAARQRQTEADLAQRRQEQALAEQALRQMQARLDESQRTLLRASAALAQAYQDKEAAEHRLAGLLQEREGHRQERQQLAEQSQAARSAWRAQQEQAHARELAVNDLRHRRDTLVDRLREDYQLDLAELHREHLAELYRRQLQAEAVAAAAEPGTEAPPASPPAPLDVNAANEEIAELRRKLSRLGTVNLDSLQELAELEVRASSLQTQFDDLTAAKRSLEEIVAQINQDSRRLFTDTFAAIRTHFQELFRKLFGGGMADIVLEDENDILECGIEIIARPPGKELRSISLMSGGEKTMTAVALLLAIFRSKPSPFCILDEVDAALDEANVGRFTAVLRDFLDRSQFIIITHSKRTMAAADVLYGVTMQESGISKRVAVRFEDWPDDGEAPAATSEANGNSFAGK